MDIKINAQQNVSIDYLKLQKMGFIYNALENGWKKKKKEKNYVFVKPHEGKKEVYLDNYLEQFIKNNFDINKILD